MQDMSWIAKWRTRCLWTLLVVVLLTCGAQAVEVDQRAPVTGDAYSGIDVDVPMPGYVAAARDGVVDSYRGISYSPFLRVVHDLGGGDWGAGLRAEERKDPPSFVGWHARVQVVQFLIFLGACAYAGRVGRLRAGATVLAAAIAMFDPFVFYAQRSLQPDGLALSAFVVLGAGQVALLRGGRASSAAVVFLASCAVMSLRVEKSAVVVAAALLLVAASWLLRGDRSKIRRRASACLALVVVAAGTVLGVTSLVASNRNPDAWGLVDFIVHARIAYPNLERIHADLPEDVREKLPAFVAPYYDASVVDARNVVDFVSANDPAVRARLTEALGRTALEKLWPTILTDIAADTIANILPSPNTLRQLLTADPKDLSVGRRGSGDETTAAAVGGPLRPTPPIHHLILLEVDTPRTSRPALAAVLVLLFVATASVTTRIVRRARGLCGAGVVSVGPRLVPEEWLPIFTLVFVNAGAFAATQDLFVPRYVVASEFVLVAGAVLLLLPCRVRRSVEGGASWPG
ncbi:MAG: hypothetical protein R3F34_09620 [Planctomycetota bacterium]